jgi:hypothetical protein
MLILKGYAIHVPFFIDIIFHSLVLSTIIEFSPPSKANLYAHVKLDPGNTKIHNHHNYG